MVSLSLSVKHLSMLLHLILNQKQGGFTRRTLELNVRSYTDCVNLHVEGGQCDNGSGTVIG